MVDCDDSLPLAEHAAVTSPASAAGVLHSSPLSLGNAVSRRGDNTPQTLAGLQLHAALEEPEAAEHGSGSQSAASTEQGKGGVCGRRDRDRAVSGPSHSPEDSQHAHPTRPSVRTEPTGPASSSSSSSASSSVRTIPGQAGESCAHSSQSTPPSRSQDRVYSGADRSQDKGYSGADRSQDRVYSGADRSQDRVYSGADRSQDRVYSGADRSQDRVYIGADRSQDRVYSGADRSQDRGYSGTDRSQDRVYSGADRSQDRGDGGGGGGAPSPQVWTGGRQHYSWVTQHISCNSCPPAWRHPLRLLQHTDPASSILASECNLTVSTNIARGLRNISAAAADTSSAVMTPVTSPLSLTCPFQHLHQWQGPQGGEEEEEGWSAESISPCRQGQLKVLMMEGVVYRFVDVAHMKVVEIYPGDGSVLISQGATARFFSHLVWKQGKLEERTFSVKTMLPPPPPSAPYCLQHLISRAHRLLTGCIHNSGLSEGGAVPCWKQAVTHVVEPLSSSLLEECWVSGHGRFSAFANGRVRVLFEDRTALDMMADFSPRLQDCAKHSSDAAEGSMEERLAALQLTRGKGQPLPSQCRLLLPRGQYVMVDLFKPGPYRRYVDAAKEWVQWVQSSPRERRQFYQEKATPHSARRSAEAELKKIECFNYIVDHSAIPASDTSPPSLPSHSSAYTSAARPLSRVAPLSSLPHPPPPLQPAASHRPGLGHRVGTAQGTAEGTAEAEGQSGAVGSDPRGVFMLQGFQSVREALLRTSQMIRDIDNLVSDQREGKRLHTSP